jgi:hypothetical protein
MRKTATGSRSASRGAVTSGFLPSKSCASYLRALLPETRHASFVHFEIAWPGLRFEDLARKHGKDADREPCRDRSEHELRRFFPAKLEAMERRDETFFRNLARLSKALFRPDYRTNEERVLEAAFELREEHCENPDSDQVKRLVRAGGVKIDDKDWSGYFKRCRLEFLAKARPGRKPAKKKRGKAK